MPSLQIRDMPEEVYEALALRARTEHRSMAQQAIVELRRIPELVARERRLEVLRRVKARIEAEPPRKLPVSPAELIREDRNR
ncbi:MAG TPA: Arc family DNA-binding protein [Thermoanaerobaculia bacterium]